MPIATTAQYKTYAGISGADYDTVLGVLITSQQAALERACGRAFDEATYTDEVYDGQDERHLWLKNGPVTTLTAVKTLADDGTETTIPATDYRLVGNRVTRLHSTAYDWGVGRSIYGVSESLGPVWPKGDGNILVTYTGGYADEDMPEDLKELLYVLVDAALDRRGENWALQQSADGVIQHTALTAMELRSKYADLIRPWKRQVV